LAGFGACSHSVLLNVKSLSMNLQFRLGAMRLIGTALLLGGLGLPLGPTSASAQSIVTAANGDPITTLDVDEHVKILRLSHKPATRADAIEDVVADRLKYDEARKWGIDPADSDVTTVLNRIAAQVKMEPQAWLQSVQKAHVQPDVMRSHLRALAAWDVYVRARNKTLGVSEEEISAQLAKQGGARVTDYSLRQIVFVLPVGASPAIAESRTKEALALRNRFTDCGTGLQLARALPDVAVREPMTRASNILSPAVRNLLADTPKGRLTPPERSPSGIELIAVCDKSDQNDQTSVRDRVQNELITNKLMAVSDTMYKELRAAAVVSKN
jgi:peptidyl-prolyl cis-trans isomerase SurA